MGKIVKEIMNQVETPGFKSVQWNGTNNKGLSVLVQEHIFTVLKQVILGKLKKMLLLK